MTHRVTSKRGFSILIVVVLLIAVILCLQLVQHVFLGTVTAQGERSATAHRADVLAESALAEAVDLIRADLNRRGTPAGDWAAGPLPSGATTRFALPIARLPLTAASRADDLALEPVQISLVSAGPYAGGESGDVAGVLTAQTTVRQRAGVSRLVTRSHGFKRVELALPAALRDVTVLLRRPERVLRGRPVNADVARLRDVDVPAIDKEIDGLIKKIDDAKSGGGVPGDVAAFLDQLRAIYAGVKSSPELAAARAAVQSWTPLPDDPDHTIALTRDPAVELARFDLPARYDARHDPLLTAQNALDPARDAVQRAADSQSRDLAPHEALAAAYRAWAVRITELLAEIDRFRSEVTLVPDGDRNYAPLAQGWARVDPASVEAYSLTYARATALLNPGTGTLERLLARLERAGEPTAGMAVVDGGAAPIALRGPHRGRWVLGFKGVLDLTSGPGDASAEPWVLLAGSARRAVRLGAGARASLVLGDGPLDAAGPLAGRLLALDLPVTASGATATLHVDAAGSAAGAPWVAVSPWVRTASAQPVP